MNDNAPPPTAAIVIMAKAPQAGAVKTRLQPFLSAAAAASVYACFLQDTAANARKVTPNVVVAYAPADESAAVRSILPEDSIFLAQRGINLNEKLAAAVRFAFERNFSPVVVIGADSPTLPPQFLRDAINALENDDVALGKTADGGFYLVGLRENYARLFDNVAWSTSLVFEQMNRNVENLGLKLFRLADFYDVDTPDDLRFLRDELLKDEEKRRVAPKTFQWLSANPILFVR